MATVKRSPKLRTQAVQRWLCTQRRMAIESGVHVVTLSVYGKCSLQDALTFFGNCPELAHTVRTMSGGWQIVLSTVKSA
jgi:hypothetical protein